MCREVKLLTSSHSESRKRDKRIGAYLIPWLCLISSLAYAAEPSILLSDPPQSSSSSIYTEMTMARNLGVELGGSHGKTFLRKIKQGGLAETIGLIQDDEVISLRDCSANNVILFSGKNVWLVAYQLDFRAGISNELTILRSQNGVQKEMQFRFDIPISEFGKDEFRDTSLTVIGSKFFESLDSVDQVRYLQMSRDAFSGINAKVTRSNGFVYYQYPNPVRFRETPLPSNDSRARIPDATMVKLDLPPDGWNSITNRMSKYDVIKAMGPPKDFFQEGPNMRSEFWIYGSIKFNSEVFSETFQFKLHFVGAIVVAKFEPFTENLPNRVPTTPNVIVKDSIAEPPGGPSGIPLRWHLASGQYPIEYEVQGWWLYNGNVRTTFAVQTPLPFVLVRDPGVQSIEWRVRATNGIGVSAWSQYHTNGLLKRSIDDLH